MKRLLIIFLICCGLVITTFLLFEEVEHWITAHVHSGQSKATYTLLSFSFMALDTLLPVPSSLLMILNGKILGPFFGTLLSLVSSLLASVFGFYLGRSANPYFDKFFAAQDKAYSNNLFQKFGNLTITISKALPVLSEAISFVAGTTAMPFKTFLLYSAIGHFVVAVGYAYLGSFSNEINSGLVTVIVIVVAVLFSYGVQLILKNKHQKTT
ncbi:TVP38/TMEM64 family protein [Adhaeribacter rhizoryzae]|uniref:VTT domain-containing protein n=1 Tax=Adhaeribacter rhizoryzae TaxID=2607907 RepID=A0A5M6D7T2_9BACT|nr:VTT domain-containing protein [Adhaeribacter rhizoryzae]KAA5542342.1 VTT domain-containing protein [Adhaeribacter rhizoryzae]